MHYSLSTNFSSREAVGFMAVGREKVRLREVVSIGAFPFDVAGLDCNFSLPGNDPSRLVFATFCCCAHVVVF